MIEVTREFHQFRQALIALVPIMQEAGIGWKDEDQYDSFDTISEALFTAFVADCLIEGPLASESLKGYRYDFPPYSSESGAEIEVKYLDQVGKFIGLRTSRSEFDSIACTSNDRSEFNLPYEGSKFYVASRQS